MSAVPLTDARTLALMCDTCGRSLAGLSTSVTCWATAWDLATDQGWTGAAGIHGPHACATCGDRYRPPRIAQWGPLQAALDGSADAAVVRLAGDLDSRISEALRAVLHRAAAARRHLVVDLAGVHLIDSVALGVLVRARQVCKSNGGLLLLAAPSRFIRTVLHTMHLEPVFPIYPDSDAALAWLGTGRHAD